MVPNEETIKRWRKEKKKKKKEEKGVFVAETFLTGSVPVLKDSR